MDTGINIAVSPHSLGMDLFLHGSGQLAVISRTLGLGGVGGHPERGLTVHVLQVTPPVTALSWGFLASRFHSGFPLPPACGGKGTFLLWPGVVFPTLATGV